MLAALIVPATTIFIIACPAVAPVKSGITSELKSMLDQDQREDDRAYAEMGPRPPADPKERQILINAWNARHRPRCDRVLDIAKQGRLSSADDFFYAGHLLQHGGEPEDHLTSHALFIVAAMKGRRDCLWESATALDSYLESVGRPQLFGTTYGEDRKVMTTFMSDAIRKEFCVPSLSKQKELEQYVRRGEHELFQQNKLACQ
jgi:hypothetical protein